MNKIDCLACKDLLEEIRYIDNIVKSISHTVEYHSRRINEIRGDPFNTRTVKHTISYLQHIRQEAIQELKENKIYQLILHTELNDHYRKHLALDTSSSNTSTSNQSD